ncbi:MAG: hypothetical protein AAGJ18_07970 [Bacteroidota bacterium]
MQLKNIQTKKRIAQFWAWFTANEPTLYYGTENPDHRLPVMEELSWQLKQLDKHIVFELSPIREGEFKELIISADGIEEAFTTVIQLVKYAPKHKNWQFTAFRPRMESLDLSISMGTIDFSYKDLFFRYVLTDKEFGVELNVRNFKQTDWEKNALFILLDALIGEYDAVKEIDWVEWAVLDEQKEDELFPFVELRELVDERKKKRK